MKKIVIVLIVLFTATCVNAQVTFGIHGNGIYSTLKVEATSDDETESQDYNRFSWKAGLIMSLPLAENFAFMPQLNVVSKGGKFDQTETVDIFGSPITFTVEEELNLTYIELPLNVVYQQNGFFIGLGPVLSYGIGGKYKFFERVTGGGLDDTDSGEADIKFDGEKDATDDDIHLKGFEFGGNILAGYRLPSGLFFNAHYNFGFSNIHPGTDDPDFKYKIRNSYFGVGVGYFFNK